MSAEANDALVAHCVELLMTEYLAAGARLDREREEYFAAARDDADALGDPTAPPRVPIGLDRAVAAFARHDAAKGRHLALLDRLRAARRDNREIRQTRARLREHSASARQELAALRAAVAQYTVALRHAGAPPERAIVAVKIAFQAAVERLPQLEQLGDPSVLMSQVVQHAIQAYYQ
jgi:hypothetical protein